MKITKKEYINSLRHDLDFYQEEVHNHAVAKVNGQDYTIWHHGEKVSLQNAQDNIAEYTEELNKIFSDKNYKPWRDEN